MKIINKNTNEIIGEIVTNRSMTVEEACELLEIKLMKTEEDFETENGYDVNDLDLVY